MLRYVISTIVIVCALFIGVTYTSCEKTETDKCASITCKNGGVCSNGICTCTADYTGTYCETRKCEANKTAKVRFQNKTGTSQTYTVLWDGSVLTTLSPGSTSDYYTVAAGQHTLHFMIANTSNEACTQSTPVLVMCSSMEYWCTK